MTNIHPKRRLNHHSLNTKEVIRSILKISINELHNGFVSSYNDQVPFLLPLLQIQIEQGNRFKLPQHYFKEVMIAAIEDGKKAQMRGR